MKTIGTTLTLLLLTGLPACDAGAGASEGSATAAAGAADADASAVATACRACHQGPLSLSGRDPAAVGESIRRIAEGAREHPALTLGDTSDAAIDALAEQLTAP